MADSTLDLSRSTPPVTDKGHGTDALGPGDTSDSGSDLQGRIAVNDVDDDESDSEGGETPNHCDKKLWKT